MKREEIEKKLDTAVSGMIPEDMFKRISENIVSVDAERIEKGTKYKIKNRTVLESKRYFISST